MFDGQGKLVAVPTQIEIGITPTVQFAGAAQSLTRTQRRAVLFSMMDQQDGHVKLTLKLAQEAEQGSDLRGVVFVELVRADERIQNQNGARQWRRFPECVAGGC